MTWKDEKVGFPVTVVIPCFKVSKHIANVINSINFEVDRIFVVDDGCPEGSGAAAESLQDSRVRVIYHNKNQGVGAAMITGYEAALESGANIVVKIDGDGQMNPELIEALIQPLQSGRADYVKGNRFDSLEALLDMPRVRIFGNAVLSLMNKFSTGYWSITDPTNGFTAINAKVLRDLPLEKISHGYFFESDMLFRLSLLRAKVVDFPMVARYGSEKSNLKIGSVIFPFIGKHAVNFWKRIFYQYYLREWSIGSIQLPLGLGLIIFGAVFGWTSYFNAVQVGAGTTAGQAVYSAVGFILGAQLLISFLTFDIQAEPKDARWRKKW